MGLGPCFSCFTVTFGIIVLISAILFGLSFKVLELNKYGLKRNTYNRKLEKNVVYKPGRYFTGLAAEFIEYPSTWQYIHYSNSDGDSPSVIGKTADASPEEVTLEITLAYRLKPEFLHTLFKDYSSLNHQDDMINSAKDKIFKVIAEYKTDDFFSNRHAISNKMGQEIDQTFRDDFYSELTMFLLREISLSEKQETLKISNIVKSQETLTQQKENEIQNTEALVNNIKTETTNQVSQILQNKASQAENESTILKAAGDAGLLEAESSAYESFKTNTNWGAGDIMWFINWQKFVENPNMDLYMGVSPDALTEV